MLLYINIITQALALVGFTALGLTQSPYFVILPLIRREAKNEEIAQIWEVIDV